MTTRNRTLPRGVVPLEGATPRDRVGVPADHLPPAVTAAAGATAATMIMLVRPELFTITADAAAEDAADAGDLPTGWRGVIILEGVTTEDHRRLEENSLKWRDLPLPFMMLTRTTYGHQEAEFAGNITEVSREAPNINGVGTFDLDGVFGREAARLVKNGLITTVSADLIVEGWDFVDECEDPWDLTCTDWYELFTDCTLAGVTLVPMPAFADAKIEPDEVLASLAASGWNGSPRQAMVTGNGPVHRRSLSVQFTELVYADGRTEQLSAPDTQVRHSIVACAAPEAPPAEWFTDPGFQPFDGRMVQQPDGGWACPLTITDDGRVFGHLARWNVCHVGIMDSCVMAPKSRTGYAYYATGAKPTADGGVAHVGQLTLAGGHADHSLGFQPAQQHYDDTASAYADVVMGEDSYGVWFAGSLLPGVSAETRNRALAVGVSGDWRTIGGSLELIAACSVNVPGFPITRTAAGFRDGKQVSLIAAGMVRPKNCGCSATPELASIEDRVATIESLVRTLSPQAVDSLTARMAKLQGGAE